MLLTVIEEKDKFNVPTGNYLSKLIGFKEMPASTLFPDSGPSWVWEFEILQGEHAGKIASRFTPQKATTNNNLGKMLSEMYGRKIAANENIDLAALVGKQYTITVGWNKAGTKTRVIMCSQAPVTPSPGVPVSSVPQTGNQPTKQATLGEQAPTSYIAMIAGQNKIIDAMEAQRMLRENLFGPNDTILEGTVMKKPSEVIYPF